MTAPAGKTIAESAMAGKTAVGSDLKNAVITAAGRYGAGETPLSIADSIARGSVAVMTTRIADSPMTTAIMMAVATKTNRTQIPLRRPAERSAGLLVDRRERFAQNPPKF